MPSTPSWLNRLRDHPDLTSTGFRLLPAETIEPALGKHGKRAGPVRIGTSDPLPANMRGIGLIFYPDNPDALYARFADQNDDDGITADVQAPSNWMGELPLVEVPIEPTIEALASVGARYIQPGRTLPPPGPFVGVRLRSPDERVRCWHEQFRRFRIPLGTIPGGEEPQDALEEVVGIERGLIFNGFLAIYQWCLMTGSYETEDGEHFSVPCTSVDTAYSRSLVTLDGRFSDAGCHLTLEIDYPPEADTASVRAVRTGLLKALPDIDQLPADVPYDVLGAVAAMRLKPQPLADQHTWAVQGDAASLMSLYFCIYGDGLLTEEQVRARVRELITPYANSPHEIIRMVVSALAKRHGFDDLGQLT